MKDDITCVFEGVAGVGGIYISNLKAAQNTQLLASNTKIIQNWESRQLSQLSEMESSDMTKKTLPITCMYRQTMFPISTSPNILRKLSSLLIQCAGDAMCWFTAMQGSVAAPPL